MTTVYFELLYPGREHVFSFINQSILTGKDNDYYLEIQQSYRLSVTARMSDNGILYPPHLKNYTTTPIWSSYEDNYTAVQADGDYYSTSSDVMMVGKHLSIFSNRSLTSITKALTNYYSSEVFSISYKLTSGIYTPRTICCLLE